MGSIRERKGSGGLIYDAQIKRRGFTTLYKTFTRKTDAKMWIRDTEAEMSTGRYIPLAEALRHTLGEAIDRFILEELPKSHFMKKTNAAKFCGLKTKLEHARWLKLPRPC